MQGGGGRAPVWNVQRGAGTALRRNRIARLEQRLAHLSARGRNPRSWSRRTRNWNFIDVVTLIPERDPVAHDAHQASDKPALAA